MINRIPSAEKKITRCPICQSSFLRVEGVTEEDETLYCPICGVKFRSSLASDHLMFLETPINFPGNIVGIWLTRPEIGKALHEYRITLNRIEMINRAQQHTMEIPQGNPTRAQAVRQARSLVAAKKSKEAVIENLVKNFQLTEYAIEEIIKDAQAVAKAQERQKRKTYLITSIIIFALLVIVAAIYFIFLR